jgi:hypothetical protein
MRVAAVSYGIGQVDALRAEHPDLMLDSLANLAQLIE